MRRATASFLIAFLWTSIAPAAWGADENPTAATGSTITKVDRVAQNRQERADGLKAYHLKMKSLLEPYESAKKKYIDERKALRVQCREDIRRSNRDTKFTTELRCMRGELTLDRELAVEEKKVLEGMPNQTNVVKMRFLEPMSNLVDALNTFIAAIDKGVFETEDELREARRNMQANYRDPMNEARIVAKADRLLYPVDALLIGTVRTQKEQTDIAGHLLPAWDDARACLLGVDRQLRTLMEATTVNRRATYRQTLADLQGCVDQITAMPDATVVIPQASSGSTQ